MVIRRQNVNWVILLSLLSPLILFTLFYSDLTYHVVYYHYILCPEMVSCVSFPWLPWSEEYDNKFHSQNYETDKVILESAYLWWMEQQIPGYKLCWKDFSRELWTTFYNIWPSLFIRPWISLAQFYYWQTCHKCAMRALRTEYIPITVYPSYFL
jgi:hypothetical protein